MKGTGRDAGKAKIRYVLLACLEAARREHPQVAGTAEAEGQLRGIADSGDRFGASSSADRSAQVDPQLPVGPSKCWLQC